ncbi:hypothetical protein [Silanimonas sp.]|jgi:hypothetical protein|uniref:hypothetical protein n=1 Tax=Silanimonas sp. TaxID=1929290 RepID=UPI0022C04B54|nr:hypothetical protein [Silanimonas sp.]MCZ8063990.1 hypothetical protein [Silanimonas sp.]
MTDLDLKRLTPEQLDALIARAAKAKAKAAEKAAKEKAKAEAKAKAAAEKAAKKAAPKRTPIAQVRRELTAVARSHGWPLAEFLELSGLGHPKAAEAPAPNTTDTPADA